MSETPPCALGRPSGSPRSASLKEQRGREIEGKSAPAGRILFEDDIPVGYAQIGPPYNFPRIWQLASGPASEDSLLLTCFYITPEARGTGNGKYLLRYLVKEATRSRVAALEAFAMRAAATEELIGFYLSQGFQLIQDDPTFPRLRLELKTLVGWQESVSNLLEHLRKPLRKPVAPIPG